MNKADKLERIAREQAKALKYSLELFQEDNYLDSEGRALLIQLLFWLDHIKPPKKQATAQLG